MAAPAGRAAVTCPGAGPRRGAWWGRRRRPAARRNAIWRRPRPARRAAPKDDVRRGVRALAARARARGGLRRSLVSAPAAELGRERPGRRLSPLRREVSEAGETFARPRCHGSRAGSSLHARPPRRGPRSAVGLHPRGSGAGGRLRTRSRRGGLFPLRIPSRRVRRAGPPPPPAGGAGGEGRAGASGTVGRGAEGHFYLPWRARAARHVGDERTVRARSARGSVGFSGAASPRASPASGDLCDGAQARDGPPGGQDSKREALPRVVANGEQWGLVWRGIARASARRRPHCS